MSPAGRPTQTTPQEWAQAALDAIEELGVAGVSVERAALRLGVSKGGFYHHFPNRRALIQAALDLWEQRFVIDLAERFAAIRDPRERLHSLLHHAAVELEPSVITKLMSVPEEPDVAAALRRATDSRLALLEGIFLELGLTAGQARDRALLAYSAYLGLAQLCTQPAATLSPPQTLAYLAHVEELLLSGTAEA